MLVDAIDIKLEKNDMKRMISDKIPLMSKVIQLNTRIKGTKLQYIEYKVITYDVIVKIKGKNIFKPDVHKNTIIMLVNTYTGLSESIESIPLTKRINVPRKCIKKSSIEEKYILEGVKNEILKFLTNNIDKVNKINIQDIKLKDIKSIYKPYWVGYYNDKSIFIEA